MTKLFKGIRGVIALVIVAFVLLVIFGLYTALNAAPSYTLATSGDAATQRLANSSSAAVSGSVTGESMANDANSSSDGMQSQPNNAETLSTLSPGGNSTTPSTNGSTPSTGTGSSASNNNNGSSATSTPSSPPASADSQKTYHQAWDEWVEEGYWEDRTIPATYGARPVYGSVCNDCGLIISGKAAAHLKETHHSGYHEDIVGYESYEITPARTAQEWVDTSHWVHHDSFYA